VNTTFATSPDSAAQLSPIHQMCDSINISVLYIPDPGKLIIIIIIIIIIITNILSDNLGKM
jgi:hypothetical protein